MGKDHEFPRRDPTPAFSPTLTRRCGEHALQRASSPLHRARQDERKGPRGALESRLRRHIEPKATDIHAAEAQGEWASLTMPLSKAGIEAWVRAVRARDDRYGQAAQSPMVVRDTSRVKAPTFVPNMLKTW